MVVGEEVGVFERAEGFVARRIAGETILVPMHVRADEMEYIVALNPVAAHIWSRLDGKTSFGDLVASLCVEFEVEAERARADVSAFLIQLREAGMARKVLG